MTDSSFVDRVADRSAEIRVVRLLLSIVALPFYVVGFAVGALWLAARWAYAAVAVGFSDVIGDKLDSVEVADAG